MRDGRSLDEVIARPEILKWIVDEQATLSDLFQEIRDISGASYDELAAHIDGLGKDHIGRIARGEHSEIQPRTAHAIARSLNVPFRKVVYAAAIGTLPPAERGVLEQDSALAWQQRRAGFYRDIHFPHHTLAEQPSASTILASLPAAGTWMNHSGDLPHVDDERSIFVEMTSTQMMPRKRPGEVTREGEPLEIPLIQPQAIVEVHVVSAGEVRSGDIVLAQIGTESANFYRIAMGGYLHKHEVYHVANRNATTRVIQHAPDRGLDKDEQRLIIGIARRIVDASLETRYRP